MSALMREARYPVRLAGRTGSGPIRTRIMNQDHYTIYSRPSHYRLFELACQFSAQELRHLAHKADTEYRTAKTLCDEQMEAFWLWCLETWQATIQFRQHIDVVEAASNPHKRVTKSIDYQDIKERVDIVELIGRYAELRRMGQNFRCLCPFHSEQSASFIVFPKTKSFHCFGCGAHGDIFDFARRIGLDWRAI